MAKAYRALSNIRYGVTDSDGNLQQKVLPYGSLVSGFTTEEMKRLWDLGVLEELEVPDAAPAVADGGASSPAAGSADQGPAGATQES